jgi:hypothetical protein
LISKEANTQTRLSSSCGLKDFKGAKSLYKMTADAENPDAAMNFYKMKADEANVYEIVCDAVELEKYILEIKI